MKKYITLAAITALSLHVMPKRLPVLNAPADRPVVQYYLHDAVKLIIKKITRLDIIA